MAELPTGLFGYVKFGIESAYPSSTASYTTPATSATSLFMLPVNVTVDDDNQTYKGRYLGGGRDIVAVVNGQYNSTLKVEGELNEDGENLWQLIYGSAPSSAGGTSTVAASSTGYSFMTEVGYRTPNSASPNFYKASYQGCRVKTAQINWGIGDTPVKYTLDIVAQRPLYQTSGIQTPTASTNAPYTGYEVAIQIPAATTKTGVQEGSLNFDLGLVELRDTQSRFLVDAQNGARNVTFTFKLFFSTINEYEDFFGNTGSANTPALTSSVTTSSMSVIFTKSTKVTTLPFTGVYIEKISNAETIDGNIVVVDVSGFATTMGSMTYVE